MQPPLFVVYSCVDKPTVLLVAHLQSMTKNASRESAHDAGRSVDLNRSRTSCARHRRSAVATTPVLLPPATHPGCSARSRPPRSAWAHRPPEEVGQLDEPPGGEARRGGGPSPHRPWPLYIEYLPGPTLGALPALLHAPRRLPRERAVAAATRSSETVAAALDEREPRAPARAPLNGEGWRRLSRGRSDEIREGARGGRRGSECGVWDVELGFLLIL